MGDLWVYIPSGSCSDCWKQKRFAEVLLDRHNKHMCYMGSFEAISWIYLAAAADLCLLHPGMSCVGPEGVAYSLWVITLFWKAHICLKSSLYASNVCASTCSSSECRLHLFRTFTNINISYCNICCSISFTRTAGFTVDRVEFSVAVSHCSKIADCGVLWFRTRFHMFHNLRMGGLWISASLSGSLYNCCKQLTATPFVCLSQLLLHFSCLANLCMCCSFGRCSQI